MFDLANRPIGVQSGTPVPEAGIAIPASGGAPAATPGQQGVFTGTWLTGDCHPYSQGYVGQLVRRWHGWAEFQVTQEVAAAIVAWQQHTFHQYTSEAMSSGNDASSAWLATLGTMPAVFWHGNMIVIDSRVGFGDPNMLEVTAPDTDGRYTIGWGWHWTDIDPAEVHTIHGHSQR